MGVVEAEKAGLDHAQPSTTVAVTVTGAISGFRDFVGLVERVSGYALGVRTGVTRRTRWPNLVRILEIFDPSKP